MSDEGIAADAIFNMKMSGAYEAYNGRNVNHGLMRSSLDGHPRWEERGSEVTRMERMH